VLAAVPSTPPRPPAAVDPPPAGEGEARGSPDGAERNPGLPRGVDAAPDIAPLHPGYGCLLAREHNSNAAFGFENAKAVLKEGKSEGEFASDLAPVLANEINNPG
jgi:hypothetical protein